MSDQEQGPRRKGRAIPSEAGQRRAERMAQREGAKNRRQPKAGELADLTDDDVSPEAVAAVSYLMQRNRYLDVTSVVSRVKLLPDGRLRFRLQITPGTEPMEVESEEVVGIDPSRLRHRRVVLISNGSDGENMTFRMLSTFRDTSNGLQAGIALQALKLVQQELGDIAVQRITQQWLRGGPAAWLDPDTSGDAPIRRWEGSGPGEVFDDEALRRQVMGE